MNMMRKRNSHGQQSMDSTERLARGLGWLGVGVGLVQTFAPQLLTRPLGLEGREAWVRACGARQLLTGLGALSDNPTPAIWARAGGDAMDLAALAAAWRSEHSDRGNLKGALVAVGAATVVDFYCARKMSQRHDYMGGITPDYSDRSGFPQPAQQMRGAAEDVEVPADMRDALPMPRYQAG